MLTRRTAILGLTSGILAVATIVHGQQLKTTPTGDIGPFYPVVRTVDTDSDLTIIRGRTGRAAGQIIEVSGRVWTNTGGP
jgi:protocatechuate 3,4-dioxygenase beta subunit